MTWSPTEGSPLSPRQLDTLHRMATGQSWTKIASDLGITVNGVGSISRQIFRKLGAQSTAHAVNIAWETGLFSRKRHGDHAGYTAHLRRGEEPCDQCRAGERDYRAGPRAVAVAS